MEGFKAIETQEQLDAIIGERLRRDREKTEERFKEYISPDEFADKVKDLNTKIAGLSTQLSDASAKYKDLEQKMAEKDASIKEYENASVKSRVAHEIGLPFDAIGFIQGDNEEAIKKSAEALKGIVSGGFVPPMKNSDPKPEDTKEAELKNMLREMNLSKGE